MNPARHHCHTNRLLDVFRRACRPPARDDDGDLFALENHLAAALDVARDNRRPVGERLVELHKRLRVALEI